METSKVAQAPLEKTALWQVRPAEMETSEATQERRVAYISRNVHNDGIL